MIWEVTMVGVGNGFKKDEEYCDRLLAENWEPFAVTKGHNSGYVYHFRRKVYRNV